MNKIINIMCCPICKGMLVKDSASPEGSLVCRESNCGKCYPIKDGIPVLTPHYDKYDSSICRQQDDELRIAFKDLLSEEAKCLKNMNILKRLSVDSKSRTMSVLDLGSGLGHTMRHLAEWFDDCYGIEIDLERIRMSYEKDRVVCGNIAKMPFVDNCFNIALSIGVAHHLANVEQYELFVKEVRRILKGNGLFMLWEPKPVFYRKMAETLVFSPIGRLFNYSRSIRTILKSEEVEYNYWLSHYDEFFSILKNNGFELVKRKKGAFKDYWVFRV